MVARDALVPRVAREDDVPLVRATSLQETLQNTAQFVGPLAAGLLIAAVAEQGTLLVAAVMFAAAMALIAGLERQRLGHDQPLTAASALADVRQGFRFIVTEPLLGPLTWLLVAWVAVYVPLSTLIFPAWFNFARESAVGPKVSKFRWFVATEVVATALLAALLATEPGSAAASRCRSGSGWSGPGRCRSSTPPTTRAPPRSCWAGSTAPRSRWS
jgi:hypothetical protein